MERVFIGNPDVSEAVFRLLEAAREGKRQQEEVRLAGQDGYGPAGCDASRRGSSVNGRHYPRPRAAGGDGLQELQHAIEYLDHAPCGFFSVNPAGDIDTSR